MIKHSKQKRILVIFFVALFFVSANILVFSTTEVQGVDTVDSIDSPGDDPTGLAWDGKYLWNADNGYNRIYMIDPSDNGLIVNHFKSPGRDPTGLTWDGQYLWLADYDDKKIYKLDSSTGEIVDSIDSPGDGEEVLAWDGNCLWDADSYDDKIYRINSSTGDVVKSIDSPGESPRGLTWDGHYLWFTDWNNIYKLSPSTGAVKDSFSYPGGWAGDLAWDGHYLWVADTSDDKIHKIDLGAESRPSVEITTPSSGDTVQGTITIFVYAKDADGIDKVDFYIDGSLVYTDTNPSNNMYAYDWDSTSVSNGKCTVKITAYDMWGNTNSDRITVTVNNVALEEPIEPYWGNLQVGDEMRWHWDPGFAGSYTDIYYELEILAIYEKSLKVKYNNSATLGGSGETVTDKHGTTTLTYSELWPWIYPAALLQEKGVTVTSYEYNGRTYKAAYLKEESSYSSDEYYEYWWDYSTGILFKCSRSPCDYGCSYPHRLEYTNAHLTIPEPTPAPAPYQFDPIQIALVVVVLIPVVIVILYMTERHLKTKKKNT